MADMTDVRARIASASGAFEALYRETGPDAESLHFALAAVAESNVAIATALADIADAIREGHDG